MTLKIPTTFRGRDGKKELERILNEVPNQENKKEVKVKNQNNIIQPSGDLRFVTDVKEYEDISKYIKSTFPNLENKFTFDKKDNVMKHSNTYLATAVDIYLKSINSEYRLATQLDLEQDLNFTKGTYNDSGLALRNLIGNNREQAKYLYEQLKSYGISEKDFPIWFNLRGLDLDKNMNFNLTDESFYKTAECLNWANETKFKEINEYGLPKKEDNSSNRKIWTSNNALSGCYLNWYSNLDSYGSNLSDSYDGGRVVLAKLRRS